MSTAGENENLFLDALTYYTSRTTCNRRHCPEAKGRKRERMADPLVQTNHRVLMFRRKQLFGCVKRKWWTLLLDGRLYVGEFCCCIRSKKQQHFLYFDTTIDGAHRVIKKKTLVRLTFECPRSIKIVGSFSRWEAKTTFSHTRTYIFHFYV